MKRVLITGATGYIGRRLVRRLSKNPEISLRLLVRSPDKLAPEIRAGAEVMEGSTFDQDSLKDALKGIECAYYLIHSMGAGKDYRQLDNRSAENFREACIQAGVKRIVYLGGLGNKETASRHLLSRIETGEILSRKPGQVQTIWLRAAVIIGSGSASFEIIRHLLQKLPIMTTPLWVRTRTQPIGILDILAYLEASLTLSVTGNLQVDVGAGVLSFGEMLKDAAHVMGLRRWLISVPLFSPRLSSYWLILMTPVDFRIAGQLVEGLRSETVIENDHAARYYPDIHPQSYREAVEHALKEIVHEQVIGCWPVQVAQNSTRVTDESSSARAVLHDAFRKEIPPSIPTEDVFRVLKGFDTPGGWFRQSRLWRIRGLLDRPFRRNGPPPWRVEDERSGKRLLLASRMRLPGRAWLDFQLEGGHLVLAAHFFPKGMGGRLYWLLVKPLHRIAFPATCNVILNSSRSRQPEGEP